MYIYILYDNICKCKYKMQTMFMHLCIFFSLWTIVCPMVIYVYVYIYCTWWIPGDNEQDSSLSAIMGWGWAWIGFWCFASTFSFSGKPRPPSFAWFEHCGIQKAEKAELGQITQILPPGKCSHLIFLTTKEVRFSTCCITIRRIHFLINHHILCMTYNHIISYY